MTGGDASALDSGTEQPDAAPEPCTTPGAVETESCGMCGTRERFCTAARVWEYGPCEGETGECLPGASEMISCGNCGMQQARCTTECTWDATGECTGEGECAPGMVIRSSDGCPAEETRELLCNDACSFQPQSDCSPEQCPTPGESELVDCGMCGTQERFCNASSRWEYGACTGEGECIPGATGTTSCGMCGSMPARCDTACRWEGTGVCTGEGTCAPGERLTTTTSCPAGENRILECDSSCAFTLEVRPCMSACPPGQVLCATACVDPMIDEAHCGASGDCTGAMGGTMCATGQVCTGGVCTTPAFPRSCRDALARGLSTGDGVYRVDPDGAGGAAAFDVFCDMTVDGGGWTLSYKVRNNVAADVNPWWNMVMPGSGTTFPTSTAFPAGSFEGPTLAARASYTTATGATEWRATTRRAGVVVFDMKSSHTGTTGRGLRCFAAGTCASVDQTCSPSITDGRVLSNSLPGPIAAGGTGYVCDVGWTDCSFCVDWSEVRTDPSAGGSTTSAIRYVGDSEIGITDTATLYWVR